MELERQKRIQELKSEKERLKDIQCSICSNTRETFTLDDIKRGDTDLFLFEQDGYCFCFFVYNLYRWIFNTDEIKPIDKMILKTNKNPATGSQMSPDTLTRLYNQYSNWYERQGKQGTIINNIYLTSDDINEFKEGMEKMESNMRSKGYSPSSEEVARAYTSEVIDVAEMDEDEEQIDKIKALYKHYTNMDF